MKKTFGIIAFLLVWCSAFSQPIAVTGLYSLKDGGVDAPSSKLCMLPDSSFYIFSFGEVVQGTWRYISAKKIELNTIPLFDCPFIIYKIAAFKNEESDSIIINFNGFDHAHGYINFFKNNVTDTMEKIYNDYANCSSGYNSIKVKNGYYKSMSLSIRPQTSRGINAGDDTTFFIAKVYNFPLGYQKKITIDVANEEYVKPAGTFSLTNINGFWTFENSRHSLENPQPIDEKVYSAINSFKMEVLKHTIDTVFDYRRSIKSKTRYLKVPIKFRVKPFLQGEIKLIVGRKKPLFFSICHNN